MADAASAHYSGRKADVVVNYTDLSSRTLGGVLVEKLYLVRGQIILLRNDLKRRLSCPGLLVCPSHIPVPKY